MKRWTAADIPDQSGRTVIVTGANRGLGFATAAGLAARGATVLMACRDAGRCSEARETLLSQRPEARLELVSLDLSDLDSVRAFAEGVSAKHDRIDLLVNNAGVMATPHRLTTAQGFELQLGVNHLGHFALTGLLLPRMRDTPGARVVTVSSFAHERGRIHFDDLQLERGYAPYVAYCQSKLANLLFMLEFDRRLRRAGARLMSVGAHPGFSSTNLQASGPFLGGSGLQAWLVLGAVRAIGQSAASGAQGQLYAAVAPGVKGGDYFGPRNRIRGPVARSHMASRACDEVGAERLWVESARLTGVDIDAAIG